MTELGFWRSQHATLNAKALDVAITRGEATYDCPANAHGEGTLTAKLNAHGEAAYERYT